MNALPGRLALLGHPVSHSLSPVFQNAALRAAGIDLRYEALDVPPEALAATLDEARANHWAGNVTVPYKESVFIQCTELTPIAQRVGAANVFRATPAGMVGHNTDVEGVRRAVRELLGKEPVDYEIGVIGAGGAAAAVLAAIEGWPGCRAIVANRSSTRSQSLVGRFRSVAQVGDVDEISGRADLVINATSLGLHPDDPLPIDPRTLGTDTAVLDLVYSPRGTPLVQAARKAERRSADGLRMLVEQGAAAFEWWFDVSPDIDLMWQAAFQSYSKG